MIFEWVIIWSYYGWLRIFEGGGEGGCHEFGSSGSGWSWGNESYCLYTLLAAVMKLESGNEVEIIDLDEPEVIRLDNTLL